MDLEAECRPAGLVLAHQVLQLTLAARSREDHVAHAAIGLFHRGLGDVKKHGDLAGDAFEVVQQLLLDALLGAHVDLVNDLDEQIDEAVGHFTLAQPAQC